MNTTTKTLQRSVLKKALYAMTDCDRSVKSKLIVNDIINAKVLDKFNNILLYNAMSYEVNVDELTKYLIAQGKQVYLPRVSGDNIEIVATPCEVVIGAYNILEPVGQASSNKIDCVIVPVLGVDKNCNRLGKGKGYYDRFFEHNDIYKIAVAFKEQMLDEIVTDKYDILMNEIYVR